MKIHAFLLLLAFIMLICAASAEKDAAAFIKPGDAIADFMAEQNDGSSFLPESAFTDCEAVVFCRFDLRDATGLEALSSLKEVLRPFRQSAAVVYFADFKDGSLADLFQDDPVFSCCSVLSKDALPFLGGAEDDASFIILTDRFGVCVYSEYDSSMHAEDISAMLENITAEDYRGFAYLDPVPSENRVSAFVDEVPVYTIYIVDENGTPVPGVMVNICTDTTCAPSFSDENGLIIFSSEPYDYKLHLLTVPKGYALDRDTEYVMNTPNIQIVIPHIG